MFQQTPLSNNTMDITLTGIIIIAQFASAIFMSTPESWVPDVCPSACACSLRSLHDFPGALRTVECTVDPMALPSQSPFSSASFANSLPVDSEALILRGCGLTMFHPTFPALPQLLHLDLSGNKVMHVPIMNAPELRSLNLDENVIVEIKDESLIDFPNLEQLRLRGNRLSSMTTSAFAAQTRLEFLDVSQNRISYIQSGWWKPLQSSLYELRLARNRLALVQSDAFRGLTSLLALDLSHNQIFRLPRRAFQGLWGLEFLDLSSNSLDGFHDALTPLSLSLKSVDLSGNLNILKLPTNAFAGYPQLKDVRLNGLQRLQIVDASAFRDLPQLVMLEMRDNAQLSYLSPDAFENVPHLTHLLLHNNNLTHIPEAVPQKVPSLQEISFYGNPLACDCGSLWMLRTQIKLKESIHLTCAYPDNYRFKLLTSLTEPEIAASCDLYGIPFFEAEISRKVGDSLELECRGVGSPQPQVTWVFPSGKTAHGSPEGSLLLPYVAPSQAGIYTCIITSEMGLVKYTTRLRVLALDVVLFVNEVDSTSVTLTWEGSDRTRHAFHIYYRPVSKTPTRYIQAALVTPIMKSLTLSGLSPSSDYEVCLSLTNDKDTLIHLNCDSFSTKHDPNQVIRQCLQISLYVTAVLLFFAIVLYCKHFTPLCRFCCLSSSNNNYITNTTTSVVIDSVPQTPTSPANSIYKSSDLLFV